jgi:outer membrane protein assembly factor BamD (BamD/ComL family)
MKKSLVTLVLALAALAAAQQPTTPSTPGQAAPPHQQKKEIKDPAEYNSYIAALREANPQLQAQAFENFLQQYPNSVVKEDALEQLMAAYEKLGNAAKTAETAGRVLQADPNNVRALALMAYTKRTSAEAGQAPQQNAAEAMQYGQRGLQALATMTKPEGMSDADFEKFKTQVAIIFNGSAGFGALQNKDYANAQKYLQAAVELRYKENPNDPTALRDVYPLALAYLEATPINPTGLWWIARAVALSNSNPQIVKYGQFKYTKYHGSPEGWDQLLAQAKSSAMPPANFAVAPAPSPAEQARILADSKDPKTMDFGEWELILSQGSPEVQQKVWSQIKGLQVPFAAKVISATRTKLELAATADAIEKNIADVTVTMIASLPVASVPKVGAEIQLQAKPDSYTQNPFMIQMIDGQLIAKPSAKPGKKSPSRR